MSCSRCAVLANELVRERVLKATRENQGIA
jgi:hypothetical protein